MNDRHHDAPDALTGCAPPDWDDMRSLPFEFLAQLRPGGPWVLTAIVPDGTTITITTKSASEVEAFIAKHNGKRNLYYSVNPTRTALKTKAPKVAIRAIEYALADLDPADGETPEAAKKRYLEQLNGGSFQPAASAGINSGNGLQCLWKLGPPVPLGEPVWVGEGKERKLVFSDEDQAKIDDVEARVKAIMLRLGAKPGTQNIDRILRLPGTINLPNNVKRKAGRVECQTQLLWFNDKSYPLVAFPKEEPSEPSEQQETDASDDGSFDDETLDAEEFQELLEYGTEKGNEPKDRSATFQSVIWHLAAIGKTPAAIIGLLRQHPQGIAAKYLKPKDRLDAEIKRSLKKYLAANPAPSLIAKWNKNHAHVLAGGKSAVLQEFTTAEGYIDFKLLSSAAFHEWNVEHKRALIVNGEKVTVQETYVWMASRHRRKYQDIGFSPGRDVPGFYNLWRGFAVEPRKGDCSKFLAHLLDNICSSDAGLYAWVIAWFADIFQRPANKCGTSLTLRGKQGVGKTKIGDVIGSLLGTHYTLVADPRYVTGRFNSHMISLLMLHADEGFWAGDKKAEGKLKDLVTGNKHPIEFKGKEAFWVANHTRLLVTGNQDWQVPAGFEERRFAVLDVGEAHIQDGAYFAAIDAEMNAGGREALLHHLLFEVDCSAVNLRQIPHTMALIEQKLETASAELGWWLDILRQGVLPGYRLDTEPQNESPCEVLYDDYIEHAKKQGVTRRPIETQIGLFLKKIVGPNLHRNKKIIHVADTGDYQLRKKRGYVYAFPALNECRQAFAVLLNEDINWGEDDDDHWG